MRRVFDHQFAAVKTLAHVYYIPNQTTLLQLNFAITTPLSLSSVSLASQAAALGVSARPRASASLKSCKACANVHIGLFTCFLRHNFRTQQLYENRL